MKILNVNICLRIIVKVVIFTFIMALFLTENVKTNLNLLTELPVEGKHLLIYHLFKWLV